MKQPKVYIKHLDMVLPVETIKNACVSSMFSWCGY